MPAPSFEYDRHASRDIREIGTRTEGNITRRLFSFATPFGYRRVAHFIAPVDDAPHAAILFVHWYEPESLDSNRTQFVNDAVALAQRGAASLLVETMWSDRDWFLKRTQADDIENSTRQVVELRAAMDLLPAQANVDARRFAYVGHDFGAMYGALMGSVDPRPSHYVLMAGTPRFPDWYLYYPKLEGDARERFIASMIPYDPITHIARLAPAPVLFQFATNDPHVPKERAQEFFDAAREPKELRWYDAGHGLNEQATQERLAWLTQKLGLR
ncbi:MAG: dienelactone hydrolase family protein [Chloroflexi bacterium]|nr:dienelactone hydrolase family protein [Chloroflexota bacterium]